MTAGDTIITLELGHYRLREQIGASVYGVVWRASGPRGTQDVALKLINEEQMARALAPQRERWIASASNEIAFLQSLEAWDERHIVRLLDSGWHRGLPVLALELLGGDLGKYIAALRARGQTLPLARALEWMAQLNQALAKVHQYGWRYLDLKPANILVDPQWNTVKLADFGTNRRLDAGQAHSYAGTANWQAPEQFFPADGGGYATGIHSDYFALGALFYFLVTGSQLRFCGACGQAYRDHHTAGAAVLLGRHDGAIPSTLHADEEAHFKQAIGNDAAARPAVQLLRRLLDADPAARPRHAIDISRQLAAIGSAAAVPLAPVTPCPYGRPGAANGWQRGAGA
ncbi:MAG: serine/threonine-protein kinase [Pseudomonadota bacterium]